MWNSPLGFTDPSGFEPPDECKGDGRCFMGGDGKWYRATKTTSPAQGGGTNTLTATVPIQAKDAARDDTPRQGSGLEGSFGPGTEGAGGAFGGRSFAEDHAGGPSVRAYDAPHDDPNWGVPDPSFGTGREEPGVVAERKAQRGAEAVVALSPHSHVPVDHSDDAMAVAKVALDVGMLFIPEGRIAEGAASVGSGSGAGTWGGLPATRAAEEFASVLVRPGDTAPLPRGALTLRDLASLASSEEAEFAVIRLDGERLLLRGHASGAAVPDGAKLIAHMHPGEGIFGLRPSADDHAALRALGQGRFCDRE